MYFTYAFRFWAYRGKPYKNCVHTARQPFSNGKTMMHRLPLHGTCIESTYIPDIAFYIVATVTRFIFIPVCINKHYGLKLVCYTSNFVAAVIIYTKFNVYR